METAAHPSYYSRSYAWREFKKNKPARLALYVLLFLGVIALLAPILANDRPLYIKMEGQRFFPAFSFSEVIEVKTNSGVQQLPLDAVDWKRMPREEVIWAPIPYSPNKSDYLNSNFVSPLGEQKFLVNGKVADMPLRFRHWLGTGTRGNDLLSGLIHGARISLTIGLLAMSIASVIGMIIGTLAGFLGDEKVLITRGRFFVLLIGIFLGWFYAFQIRSHALHTGLQGEGGGFLLQLLISTMLFVTVVMLFWWLGKWMGKISWFSKRFFLPVDSILSRLVEIFVSLPVLMLIFTIAAISRPSLTNVMIIIGLTGWTEIARLLRAEMLRIREMEYVQSAQALGFNSFRIIMRHVLPNALAPALIAVSFGIANAILIESALSFIGVGTPRDITTWGSLVNAGRQNFSAWWMVVFPGVCILITVLCFNLIGEGWRDAMDPKLKR